MGGRNGWSLWISMEIFKNANEDEQGATQGIRIATGSATAIHMRVHRSYPLVEVRRMCGNFTKTNLVIRRWAKLQWPLQSPSYRQQHFRLQNYHLYQSKKIP